MSGRVVCGTPVAVACAGGGPPRAPAGAAVQRGRQACVESARRGARGAPALVEDDLHDKVVIACSGWC